MCIRDRYTARKTTAPLPGHENALFLSTQRKRIGVQAVENLVKKYARQVTTNKKITPHKLRSTYGKMCIRDSPYTVERQDDVYVVEGPKIEKMLGYTNLDSEKGFAFFQKFLKDTGILDELEEAGIQEGDTVKMYGLQFDYYK